MYLERVVKTEIHWCEFHSSIHLVLNWFALCSTLVFLKFEIRIPFVQISGLTPADSVSLVLW